MAVVACIVLGGGALAAAPASWDGLVKVNSKKLFAVYLLPGADFRGYTSVLLDPPEVAFHKDWQRNMNSSTKRLSRRISDDDAVKIADQVRTGFGDIFAKAYQQAGYQVVTAPGPHVLRVRTAITNLYISAPDTNSGARTRVYSVEAGGATLIVEALDSQTDALLGRAADSRVAGDSNRALRTSVSNRADFGQLFTTWAKAAPTG
jgi:hypothetical protein